MSDNNFSISLDIGVVDSQGYALLEKSVLKQMTIKVAKEWTFYIKHQQTDNSIQRNEYEK